MSEFNINKVVIQPDILQQFVDGEMVLLNLQSESYFSLNEVGSRIWQLLDQGNSLDNIHEILQEEYDVSPELLHSDIETLIDELLRANLVREVE